MKVKVAETAGFCFGVKRAVNKVYELIDTEQKPILSQKQTWISRMIPCRTEQ